MRLGPPPNDVPRRGLHPDLGPQDITTENADGRWVPAIPIPYYWSVGRLGVRQCGCGRLYWTTVGYRGHYALRHILKL